MKSSLVSVSVLLGRTQRGVPLCSAICLRGECVGVFGGAVVCAIGVGRCVVIVALFITMQKTYHTIEIIVECHPRGDCDAGAVERVQYVVPRRWFLKRKVPRPSREWIFDG